MKHYLSPLGELYAYEEDGSQDELIPATYTLCPEEQVLAIQNPKPVAVVPTILKMKQARLALLDAGLLTQVNAGIAQMPMAAQIEWEFSETVERGNNLVATLTQALSLTDAQLDALFTKGATFK